MFPVPVTRCVVPNLEQKALYCRAWNLCGHLLKGTSLSATLRSTYDGCHVW